MSIKQEHKCKEQQHRLFYEVIKRGSFFCFLFYWVSPRLQHPDTGRKKTLSARPSNSDNFVSLFPPHPAVPGRSSGGSALSAATRLSGSSPAPGERKGGLAQLLFFFFVGVGFCLQSISRTISALLGENFCDCRESQVNLIGLDGPAARKGAGVKFTPASLRLRICGLCGDTASPRRVNPVVFSRLNDPSKKPLKFHRSSGVFACKYVSGCFRA